MYQVLVIIAIVIVVNIIAVDYFARLDLTDDNRYTLSDATIDIVQNLEEPVTVTAYFTEDLPPRLRQSGRNFKDLLIEYASYSDGMINYEFIDPADDDEIKQQAAKAGVQPVIVNVREEDQVKQQRAFLGAVIRKGEQKEVLPVITEAESMEYSLSSGIKKLSVKERPLVGFVTGARRASPCNKCSKRCSRCRFYMMWNP
ncbi:MAG: GldG family protein [Bacteroidales bacterium]|nr:GldG family protein [Bacteroidales bacterium]